MAELVGALDQGTTSTRFIVFDGDGAIVSSAQKEHEQIFPHPGWVEHDPMEIVDRANEVITQALGSSNLRASDLAAIGVTNQRETTVVWERDTGRPVSNAIVWQDTRTAGLCEDLAAVSGPDRFRGKTGLPLATYFSGPKARWLLEELQLSARAARGEVLFGTIDSWLIWNLTDRVHVTDVTNASRTMLMDLATLGWDSDLALEMGVPTHMLPDIVPSVGHVAEGTGVIDGVSISAILGDQQAALFGQACFSPGEAKSTYGTGNFLLMNTGDEIVASNNGLLTTVAYRIGDQPARYALEGSIAVTGSLVQWLRDGLGLISDSADVEDLAATVHDNGDVYLVPAFSGLFAPHWRPDARGVLVGLTRYSNRGHVARAALESTAFQTREVLDAMIEDSGVELPEMKVDGGMTENELLMQFQADLLGVDVVKPRVSETTALGAGFAAGLAAGVWSDLEEIRNLWVEERRWTPAMSPSTREGLMMRWGQALERSLGWVQ